jgi:hypothetical protein
MSSIVHVFSPINQYVANRRRAAGIAGFAWAGKAEFGWLFVPNVGLASVACAAWAIRELFQGFC